MTQLCISEDTNPRNSVLYAWYVSNRYVLLGDFFFAGLKWKNKKNPQLVEIDLYLLLSMRMTKSHEHAFRFCDKPFVLAETNKRLEICTSVIIFFNFQGRENNV
jgi:hypothetical protein